MQQELLYKELLFFIYGFVLSINGRDYAEVHVPCP